MKMIVMVIIQASNFQRSRRERVQGNGTSMGGRHGAVRRSFTHPAPHERIQPTAYSVRSCLALSEPYCHSGARITPVYFLLHTTPAALVHRHCDASLLPRFRALCRRVMHKSPGSLRPPPWLGRAIEDLVRAIWGEIVSQCGFAVSTQGVSLGDDLLAVHDPTHIESFTERTEGMAHTTLLLSPCPLKRGDAA